MEEQYILMKRGLYYRPDAAGYASSLLDAGLYSRSEATKRCAQAPDVTMKRLIETIDAIDVERAELKGRLALLDKFERKALGLRCDG
jgi:hypothetical protein